MRTIPALFCLLLCAPYVEAIEAFDALKLLPKEQAARIALIEGRDGTPAPARWYLLVHDPAAPNGLREYAVAGNEVVASRTISQFAETLSEQNVMERSALSFDSDDAARLAQDFARANNLSLSTMNFELKKDGPDGVPTWTVTCLDGAGAKVAHLLVTSNKGTVVSHEGFAVKPERSRRKKEKLSTYAETQVTKPRPRPPEQRRPPRREPEPTGVDRVRDGLRRFFGR